MRADRGGVTTSREPLGSTETAGDCLAVECDQDNLETLEIVSAEEINGI